MGKTGDGKARVSNSEESANSGNRENRGNVLVCAFIALMAVAIIVACVLANAESERNKSNYTRYRFADELLENDESDKALVIYKELIPMYPRAYILEYKAAMCEYNLANYESAKVHGLKALELWPFLVNDGDYLSFLESILRLSGDDVGADVAAGGRAVLGGG